MSFSGPKTYPFPTSTFGSTVGLTEMFRADLAASTNGWKKAIWPRLPCTLKEKVTKNLKSWQLQPNI